MSAAPTEDRLRDSFLAGGGEMGALIRAYDWSSSELGDPATWPQSLRTVVRLMLNTRHPIFVFWGPNSICLYNDAYSASLGPEKHPVGLGRPGRLVWAEIWETIGPQIAQVMAGGPPTWFANQLIPIIRFGDLQDAYWTYSYSPIDDESSSNGVGGALVLVTETTDQVVSAKDAEVRQALVRGELQHRIKNTLAMVSAIATQTLRGDDIADRRASFSDRLAALASAHDMLMANDAREGSLRSIVDRALAPHMGGEPRFTIAGPPVKLTAKQSLSMALVAHELATNAAKYGALSTDKGTVSIRWGFDEEQSSGAPTFTFRWEETGGPPVQEPKRKGFGSRLINRVLEGDFSGRVGIDYAPTGVVCVLVAPATSVSQCDLADSD